MDKLNISDRTESSEPRRPRITIKNHKVNIITDPSVRLICPNSSDLRRLIKKILDKQIDKFRQFTEL